jgi:hypothetical protein
LIRPADDKEASAAPRVVTIYRTDANNLISDYRVYTDVAPVFAGLPAAAVPPVS